MSLGRHAAVHLRPRGEHIVLTLAVGVIGGSPPPARRTRDVRHRPRRECRFTSARAENTSPRRTTRTASAVHLRPRGEHGRTEPPRNYGHGSPPPARRTPGGLPGGRCRIRFTSARAENTSTCRRACRPRPVHLRPRGEHVRGQRRGRRGGGSPPPARRTRREADSRRHRGRFTSARAENTGPVPIIRACPTVHLRPRGEHYAPSATRSPAAGSPPPARRTRHREDRQEGRHRFTSARAENTSTTCGWNLATAVHLRPRGEHVHTTLDATLQAGSPPPARRTPLRDLRLYIDFAFP